MHRRFMHGGPGEWEDPRLAFGSFDVPFGPPGAPWFGGPFGHHGRGHRRGRMRRGNVRAAILALLAERPMHGYEMIQELIDRTQGVWRPSPGSVYPALQLLEDEGLIASEQTEGKRLFSLTDAGRAEAERDPSAQAPWEEATEGIDPAAFRLREAVGQTLMAVMQVARAGNERQRRKALEVLAETRRQLYGILVEDEGEGQDEDGE
jgi:DNA-binding PadR family transcriptional regulator